MKRWISMLLVAAVLAVSFALPASGAEEAAPVMAEMEAADQRAETEAPPAPEGEEEIAAQPESVEEAERYAGKKLAAITYDDGPGPYTDQLLDGLKARGVKATFFMLGSNAARYPAVVERAYQEGHQIANHSYDHSNLANLSEYGVQSQVQRTNAVLDRACGKGTGYMVRLPYGSGTAATLRAVGAPLAMWAVDPQDWLYRNAETVKNRIVGSTSDGDIILVHDIHATTIPGSLAAIDILQARGYEFVTINELFRRRGTALRNGVQVTRCAPTGSDLGPVKAPVISAVPEGGQYRVTITAQDGASIYYSTDGKALNQASKRYSGPFLASTPCTVRAVAAFNMNGGKSDTVSKALTMPVTATPRIDVTEGVLTVTCDTPGAAVTCVLNGEAGLYTGPVALEPGTEISVYAGKEGWLDSPAVRASYSSRGNFFRDVWKGQWYYEQLDRAVSAGYLGGVGGGRFAPGDSVSRAQLMTMLFQWSGESVDQETVWAMPFSDVAQGKYYTKAVAWAYDRGLATGFPDGTFRPERSITRQEMSLIFANLIRARGVTLPDSAGAAEKYTDRARIAGWALRAVEQMTATGLFSGNDRGAFLPEERSSRAQAAVVLMAFADWMESQEPGDGSSDGQEPGDGSSDGQEPGDGSSDGQEPGDGSSDGQEPGDGSSDGQEPGDGSSDGQEPGDGSSDGQEPGDGPSDGQEPGDGSSDGQESDGTPSGSQTPEE